MWLRDKHINDIIVEDILYLRDGEVAESKVLDYKLQLPEDNKKFLADITSFANTDGGSPASLKYTLELDQLMILRKL